MKKIIAAIAITTTLVLTGCGTSQSPKQADRIEEDEAGWDCHTMGNKVCGEDLPKGVVLLPESECPLIQPVCYDHMTPWTKGN
jgi:hypothetical protein